MGVTSSDWAPGKERKDDDNGKTLAAATKYIKQYQLTVKDDTVYESN
jgi:hypothetical protein